MEFIIEVQDRRNGNWRERTRVSASDRNAAVKGYVVSKNRAYGARNGYAKSAKGKLFRAVEA